MHLVSKYLEFTHQFSDRLLLFFDLFYVKLTTIAIFSTSMITIEMYYYQINTNYV